MTRNVTIHVCSYHGDVLEKIQTKLSKTLKENSVFSIAGDIFEVLSIHINNQSNETLIRVIAV